MALVSLWPAAGAGAPAATRAPMAAAEVGTRATAVGRPPVHMARGTWDTGWFQAEIYKQLVEALGYPVEGPHTMGNWGFYQAVAKGRIDFWVNGWLPSQSSFMADEGIRSKVAVVGHVVKAGALQGYLVDARSAKRYGITTLADLKDPQLAKHFDRNGNGKADLIGCNVGWACAQTVAHHIEAYGLGATVEQIQGDYAPLMAAAVERVAAGRPTLFYTWTPNWTIGRLVPGLDVRWLEVPFASLPAENKAFEARIAVDKVAGCAGDPCRMGFPPNDIRAVANREFLAAHPDIRRLLERVSIPLADISLQNARMIAGEDSLKEIAEHAAQWLAAHRDLADRWLAEALPLQLPAAAPAPASAQTAPQPQTPALKVVTQVTAPFVIYRDGRYQGFTIELWERIARSLDLRYEIYGVNTIAKLTDELQRGAADVALSGIGITAEREKRLDFSHSFLGSGLQIMISEASDSLLAEIFGKVLAVIFAPELLYGVGLFLLVLIAAAHILWLLERGHNPQFSKQYFRGLWQAIWWAVVTVTTVGYGDKTPTGMRGRAFGLVWILAGYFVFAYFTATVTSTVTVRELHSFINDPTDLFNKRVATVEKSTASAYLSAEGIPSLRLKTIAAACQLLENGQVDAIVYDAPVLQHYAKREGKGKVKVVGLTFEKKSYGFAFPVSSDLRDRINVAMLELMEDGTYQQIRERWFLE